MLVLMIRSPSLNLRISHRLSLWIVSFLSNLSNCIGTTIRINKWFLWWRRILARTDFFIRNLFSQNHIFWMRGVRNLRECDWKRSKRSTFKISKKYLRSNWLLSPSWVSIFKEEVSYRLLRRYLLLWRALATVAQRQKRVSLRLWWQLNENKWK